MRLGITTSRGWLGVACKKGEASFGLLPKRGLTIIWDREQVLDRAAKVKSSDFWTTVRVYAHYWWQLGRPMPWTVVRRARAHARWQEAQRNRKDVKWPFDEIADHEPAVEIRID